MVLLQREIRWAVCAKSMAAFFLRGPSVIRLALPAMTPFTFAVVFFVAALTISRNASAVPITLDFETEDDFTTALANGQDISSPDEFGVLVNINALAEAKNQGAAIFDSTIGGPNAGGGDPDLLVDLGNILILQSNDSPNQTTSGIFDTPNDEADGGTLIFDFLQPAQLLSIDLVDINGNGPVTLTLTDGGGDTRTYSVPKFWTFDINVSGPNGFDTLDLTTLAAQIGEGGSSATASEDAGFDPNNVIKLEVLLSGSAGLDNLKFETTVPEPGTLALLGGGLLLLASRLRKRHAKRSG